MDNTTVAEGDKFMAVVLATEDKRATLPVEQLPLDDIQIALNDGRIIHVRHLPGGHVVQVTDLDGDPIAELAVPPQKIELQAKAAKLRKAADRLSDRLREVAEETAKDLAEADLDEATALPQVISLPGPKRVN